MKYKFVLPLLAVFVLAISCKKDLAPPMENTEETFKTVLGNGSTLKIAVVSDIHYLSPSLLANNAAEGKAFKDYLAQDPKLLAYSDPILRSALASLQTERPDVVLIPGDLTKDGEKASHLAMAGYLDQLSKHGTRIFVLPGNHDINNAKAMRYDGDKAYPVATIQANDFSNIYNEFCFKHALSRDKHSLSYVAKAAAGLWILALDASRYEEYDNKGDIAAGRLKPETLQWALERLADAKKQKVTVYGMMHHNLVEHYAGQDVIDPGYVVADWQKVTHQLMDAGLRVIFTGHYHANDITAYQYNGKTLYDVETGSLVTPTSPFRIINVHQQKLDIRTLNIQSIPAALPGGVSFGVYSDQFINAYLDGYFYYYLTVLKQVDAGLATLAAPLFRTAVKAHFAGDENMTAAQQQQIAELGLKSMDLAAMATTLWSDLGVKDNNVVLQPK